MAPDLWRGSPSARDQLPSRWRREARSLVELLALCGFAVTQPLLDVFGRGVEQFSLRGATGAQVVLFGLAVTLLPAVVLAGVEAAIGVLSARARPLVHQLAIAGLVGAVVVQAARPLAAGPLLLALAVVAGALAVAVYRRAPVARLWLGYTALAPVGYLGLFLFSSTTSALIWDRTEAAAVTVGSPAPVVMVVFDELPLASLLTTEGTIDADLYPNFSRLAAGAHWYRNATTVTSTTWHAVPTIVTGQLPREGTGPVASLHPDNLFTLLGGSYELRVTETISRLCPVQLCPPSSSAGEVASGLAGDAVRVLRSKLSLTRSADDPVTGFADLGPEEPVFADLDISQPDRFRSLVEGLDADRSAFHYLHLLLPHVPYRHLPSGRVYDGPIPDLGRIVELDQWGAEQWPVVVGRQRHLLQLAYVDRLVGVLLDEMQASGLYDDALVVVTADHGISFEPGGAIRSIEGQPLDAASAADTLWVPLFIKEPRQAAGTISDENVLLVDIVPTIADVLDIDLPFRVDGRSVFGPPRSTSAKPFYGNDVTPLGVGVLDPVQVDGASGWDAVLDRSAGTFLPGPPDPQRLWRLGPAPDLVGQSVEQARARLAATDAVLVDADRYLGVAAAGPVPVLVRGHLANARPGDPLAVVVNGTVAATGPVYTDDGAAAFAVMIDEALLHDGSNEVEVFAIVG